MKEFLVNSDFGLGWQFIKLEGVSNRRLGLIAAVAGKFCSLYHPLLDTCECAGGL